jgi:hypothetical protein
MCRLVGRRIGIYPAGWTQTHDRGRVLAEGSGEPPQGAPLTGRMRVAFEASHGGSAYSGPVGQLSLRQAVLVAQLS